MDDAVGRILAARADLSARIDAAGLPIDDADAYSVQARITQSRLARGEAIVGWKLGYTSAVMREQMGIDKPNFGPLTDAMVVPDGGLLPPARQPRAEPEVAIVCGRDVTAPVDTDSILDHVDGAILAIEIVDSVWLDYRFTWAQNTADGSSAAYVVRGTAIPLDLVPTAAVEFSHNGRLVGNGTAAAAMGNPLTAVAWLANQLLERGECLRAGQFVITGGLCAAVPFEPGDSVTARSGTASVSVSRA